MKILSKYRDFYDYLSKIYGEDPKIILDRRKADRFDIPSDGKIMIYFCGWIYEGFVREGRIYWGKDLLLFGIRKPKREWDSILREKQVSNDFAYISWQGGIYSWTNKSYGDYFSLIPYKDKYNLNRKYDCAIFRRSNIYSGNDKEAIISKYPKLSDLGIQSILTPKDAYLILSAWLAPKDTASDNQTDKEKIVSNGFDTKTSFRNIK